jgi:hypothetical protein
VAWKTTAELPEHARVPRCRGRDAETGAYGLVVAGAAYRYELRRGDEIVATGHLTNEEPLEIGQTLRIGISEGVIRTIEPLVRDSELRIVVQLADESRRA